MLTHFANVFMNDLANSRFPSQGVKLEAITLKLKAYMYFNRQSDIMAETR